jgi:hypothetical protein
MRIAATISGQPRFCKEFNSILQHTQHLNVDWYVHVWSHNPPPDNPHNSNYVMIADGWRYPTKQFVEREFACRLPSNHRLVATVVEDFRDIIVPALSRQHCGPPERIIYHWTSWRMVRDLIEDRYDWIIRTRADVGLDKPIPFEQLKPRTVYTAHTAWHGYENQMNDIINVGDYDSIMCQLSVIDHYENYLNKVKFHPETMVATHIKHSGFRIEMAQFGMQFRTTTPIEWGGWDYAAD